MNDTPNQISPVQPEGSFLTRALWTVFSPKRVFEDIESGAHWFQPWIWVSLINMAVAYVSVPIQTQLYRMNPGDVSEEQVEQTLAAMEKFGFLGVISTPVVVLVTGLIIAGIGYFVVSMLSQVATFKKYFTLYLYCSIVSSLGLLLATTITRMRGVENIRTVEDAVASFGPAMFLEPGHKILHPILSNLDLFYVWFYVLLGMGVVHIFKVSPRSAALAVIPVWLLFVLIGLVSSQLGNLSS